MPDMRIGELPEALALDDNSLLVTEQQGEARHFKGLLLKEYAKQGVTALVAAAQSAAEQAEKAAQDAQNAANSVAGASSDAAAAKAAAQAAESARAAAVTAKNAAEQAATMAAQNAVSEANTSLAGYVSAAQSAQRAAEEARDQAQAVAGGDFLPIAGGKLTGPLTLSGDPTAENHAANKKYVDDKHNELFQSVSDGKATVASAVTDMGVDTAADATFATMAQNIRKIETAVTPEISVDANGLITAAAGDKSATKQLPTQAKKTITPGTSGQTAIAEGVYATGAVTVAGDANLVSENIVAGKSIFGKEGSAEPASALSAELTEQDGLIAQIASALEGLNVGGGIESCAVTIKNTSSSEITYSCYGKWSQEIASGETASVADVPVGDVIVITSYGDGITISSNKTSTYFKKEELYGGAIFAAYIGATMTITVKDA